MARLLIIGASRGIGLAVTTLALEQGFEVRAFARHASSIDINHERLEKYEADALDPASIGKALADCDIVIQSLGVPFNLQLFTGPITLFSKSTRILVDAMQSNGPKRLIAVTGYGAGDCYPHIHPLQKPGFKLVFGRAYADKSLQEEAIKRSSLDWTILRPGVLTNGPQRHDYHVLREPADWINGAISRASVAHCVLEQCTQDDLVGQAPVVVQQRWF